LQQLGVVDAVFSQDSDTLMFGCDYLLRDDRIAKESGNSDRSKENTKKSGKSMRVVRGQDIAEIHKLDRDGLVLLAMLAGGDYDITGLKGCGSATACRAVKAGLGRSLSRCRTKMDCMTWQGELNSFLQTASPGSQISVPPYFPDMNTLNKYLRPTVSSDEQLLNLRGLRNGWSQPLCELKLLELTSSHFNIWGRLYMNWVGPVLLMKSCTSSDSTIPLDNPHQITLKRQRAKKNDDGITLPKLEHKITFSPFRLTTLSRADFEGKERSGYWTGVATEPFDPNHRVEWDFPAYWLRVMLPHDALSSPPSTRKKASQKRRHLGDEEHEHLPSKRNCPPNMCAKSTASSASHLSSVTVTSASRPLAISANQKTFESDVFVISDTEDSDSLEELDFSMLRTPSVPHNSSTLPRRTQSHPVPVGQQGTSAVPKLGDTSDEFASTDDPDLRKAKRPSLQEIETTNRSPTTILAKSDLSKLHNRKARNQSGVSTPGTFHSSPILGIATQFPPSPGNAARVPIRTTSQTLPNKSSRGLFDQTVTAPPSSSELEQVRASRRRYFSDWRKQEESPKNPSTYLSSAQRDRASNPTPLQRSTKKAEGIYIDLTED
jgi:Holliday junction resolvase YEN1